MEKSQEAERKVQMKAMRACIDEASKKEKRSWAVGNEMTAMSNNVKDCDSVGGNSSGSIRRRSSK
jgi:hypothetical protein